MKKIEFFALILLHLFILIIYVIGTIKIIMTGSIAGAIVLTFLGTVAGTSAIMLIIEYIKRGKE